MKNLLGLVYLVLLTGCAAMPVPQSLGENRHEKGWNKDNGNERLVTAFILQELPEQEGAIGFEIEFPEELKKSALVGVEKEFSTFNGVAIRLTRKAFQGKSPEVGSVSVIVSGEKGKVFATRSMKSVTVFSPEGEAFQLTLTRQLSPEEVEAAYQGVQKDFPWISTPIEGSGMRYHFGEEAIQALDVPQTVTFSERGANAGLGSIVLTDPIGIAISKAWALAQTVTTSPVENSLVATPVKPIPESSFASVGDK